MNDIKGEKKSPERTVWYCVADVSDPHSEPFMVLRVDTTAKVGNGVEGTVESMHWKREDAEAYAEALNAKITGAVQ